MDHTHALQQSIIQARQTGRALRIEAGQSKRFISGPHAGLPLDLRPHRGIIDYDPSELVLTARAATPVAELESTLQQHNQMLAFEPPLFNGAATLGGTVACNISGPRRPYAGAARDFVLGVTMINGLGEVLRFGGRVMKNVAGFDVAKLLCGSYGVLGAMLDVSLKVLPRPRYEITLMQECDAATALDRLRQWHRLPLPLTGACHYDNTLFVRLSGNPAGVKSAQQRIGGEAIQDAPVWNSLREWRHPMLREAQQPSYFRLSMPQACDHLPLAGNWLIDWGGGLRWLKTQESWQRVAGIAVQNGGFASRVSGHAVATQDGTMALLRRLKLAFDPNGLFNPGCMGLGEG